MDIKDEDQKPAEDAGKNPAQAVAKPTNSKPGLKQPRWPGLGGNSGIKNARSVHGRMPTGRGSARGR